MKNILYIILLALSASIYAAPVHVEWNDNSTNETGFEMRGRLPDGVWEVINKTAENVNSMVIESEAHNAWQVFAFNQWGYSSGSNILEKGQTPESPGDTLRVKEQNNNVTNYDNVKSYKKLVKSEWRS